MEIGIVTTKINLVLINGDEREFTNTEAFSSTRAAWQYAKTAKAYDSAYHAALDTLHEGETVKWYFPLDSQYQTLILQSEA